MPERNLCHELGCPAACCRDIYMEYSGDITEHFPEAKMVDYYDLDEMGAPGVYYIKYQSKLLIRIVGKCPNLGEDFSCKIYDHRPAACENFEIGNKLCLNKRKNLPQ